MAKKSKFDLFKSYVHIDGAGCALQFKGDDAFWKELMSGPPTSEAAKRCYQGGWLIGVYDFDEDWPHWEMHPQGEEILTCVSGEIEMTLDHNGKKRRAKMATGSTLVVPRGAWHIAKVKKPAQILGITFGKGTQHRPA